MLLMGLANNFYFILLFLTRIHFGTKWLFIAQKYALVLEKSKKG
jgi:hypothetical protein